MQRGCVLHRADQGFDHACRRHRATGVGLPVRFERRHGAACVADDGTRAGAEEARRVVQASCGAAGIDGQARLAARARERVAVDAQVSVST